MAAAEPERPLRVVLISWKTVKYEDDSWNSYVTGRRTVMMPATTVATSSSVWRLEEMGRDERDTVAVLRAAVSSPMSGVTVASLAVPPETSASGIRG
jgi:hypothetical protein